MASRATATLRGARRSGGNKYSAERLILRVRARGTRRRTTRFQTTRREERRKEEKRDGSFVVRARRQRHGELETVFKKPGRRRRVRGAGGDRARRRSRRRVE